MLIDYGPRDPGSLTLTSDVTLRLCGAFFNFLLTVSRVSLIQDRFETKKSAAQSETTHRASKGTRTTYHTEHGTHTTHDVGTQPTY